MEKSIIAFISLGFSCGGPEEGEYGKFTVDLSEEEIKAIDEVVKTKTTVYKRTLLKKRYPDVDRKIVEAARGLVRDVLVNYPELFEDLTDADIEAMSSMTYHERADYLVSRFSYLEPEPETIKEVDVCYYLCNEEITDDYAPRYH